MDGNDGGVEGEAVGGDEEMAGEGGEDLGKAPEGDLAEGAVGELLVVLFLGKLLFLQA